jgi:hypothetical protein
MMGINEDRDEFNSTGIRGLLRQVMRTTDEAFVRELPGGWRGEIVSERPSPGSGPYLHFRRGFPVLRYDNASPEDKSTSEFRVEV